MKPISRILLFVCGLSLIVVLFVPMWRIELDAPQYPEGLMMQIYPNKLGGNVAIINGLNHYIGMKTLHNEDFIEFKILPGIIIFFALAFALVAVLRKRKLMEWLLGIFISFGVIAMIDFYRWEYAYGHDLNPDAAIRIPGMAYQPPLIGFKQLLNFGAYSVPDIGGWIFIAVGICLLTLVIVERKRMKKIGSLGVTKNAALFVIAIAMMSSCSTAPEPIKLGKDNCFFCKMTISDARYGAELVTKKGKVFKFDDSKCLLDYIHADVEVSKEIGKLYLVDFNEPHLLLDTETAFILRSEEFKSPMNGFLAAFSSEAIMKKMAFETKAEIVSWKSLIK